MHQRCTLMVCVDKLPSTKACPAANGKAHRPSSHLCLLLRTELVIMLCCSEAHGQRTKAATSAQ